MGPDFTDQGCTGSGLEVTFGTQTFNEANPTGMATIPSASGCDSTFNVVLTFEVVNLALEGGDPICSGNESTLTLVTTSQDIFNITINSTLGDMQTFSGVQSGFEFNVSPISTSTYFIEAVDGTMCEPTFDDQIEIQVSEIDVEIIPSNTNGGTIDCGEEGNGVLEASVSGAIGQLNYEWNQGSTAPIIENLNSGAYSLVVIDEIGCSDSDNFELINQSEIEIDFMLETTGCDGSNGTLTILGIQGGSSNLFSISVDDEPSPLSQPTFPITFSLASGVHIINVVDEFGCSKIEEFEIISSDPADVFLIVSETQTVEQGSSVILNVDGNFSLDSIVWSPATGLSCIDCTNPIAQPTQTTIYDVTAFDASGCSATAQILVRVDRQTNIFVPNVFSPNDDGFNDVFYVFGGSDVSMVRSFSIFDRWGNQVFFVENVPHSDPRFGWNGKFRGKKKQADVFVYFGVIELIDGTLIDIEGNVTLIK
jgi:gliding motility-associated-like protein